MKNVNFNFGKRLKEIRKSKGLTQTQVADMAHLGQSTISQYETGARSTDVYGLAKVLDSLNVSFAEFFCECSSHKRRTDPKDFNPSSLRKHHLRAIK